MKTKIIILAICAAVVIGGCAAGVALLRKPATEEDTTTGTTVMADSTANDYSEYYSEVPEEELSTDANGNTILNTIESAASNVSKATQNALATTVKIIQNNGTTKVYTVKNTTTKNNTTRKTSTTKKKTTTGSGSTYLDVKDLIGDNASQSFLGYRYSSEGDGYYYCDDKDNWQKDTGYNEVYDKWAPLAAMHIDQVRIRFQYGGQNWMIQLWKGQYGYVMIGAEIGVYTCDLDEYSGGTGDINHFDAADKENWLQMQLDCYYCKGGEGTYKKIFTRPYDTYWWATGFVKGQLTKYTAPRTELKTKNRITFKSEEQANLFVQGLKLGGFRRAAGADQLVDDSYYMSGKDVWVLFSTINQDSFVGY